MDSYDVVIIGGGPAGSACALYLLRTGLSVCVMEKLRFPRETICGEFLSSEAAHALQELGLLENYLALAPSVITTLCVHTPSGRNVETALPFTAYGMKRGRFDHFLLGSAASSGAALLQPAEAMGVRSIGNGYLVSYEHDGRTCEVFGQTIVAAIGKQSAIDGTVRELHARKNAAPDVRRHTLSHLNGVKVHIPRKHFNETNAHMIHIIADDRLYCGVNPVDEEMVTVCFLEHRIAGDEPPRARLRRLYEDNPAFRRLFTREFMSICERARVYGSGNIFFGTRRLVRDGVFMAGDAAGVIAPLAGDGMGMAFEGAHLLADVLQKKNGGICSAHAAESLYSREWTSRFRRRRFAARVIQSVLLNPTVRDAGLQLLLRIPSILPRLVRLTRSPAAPRGSRAAV
ncbi:MAG TPA: NAD(P)/FAD-dependent oxidoreductase [Bacteroidota bacterium]|nr:NAD(P)/FAD-dependent oxidoreductase [Bacteroidota bacterium]